MFSVTDPADLPADFADTAVVIGKFDSLHLGHQALLQELVEIAQEQDLAPVVLTFDKHPDNVLKPGRAPLPIIGSRQKQFHIEKTGVAALLTLPFDEALAKLPAEEFIAKYLVQGLRAKFVLVGQGNRFGAGGLGSIAMLRELGPSMGFRARELPPIQFEGQRISTTRIRDLLDAGNVAEAAKLLGRNHVTTGVVEHGRKIGRSIGFPTANLARNSEGYLPRDGIYAGWLHADGVRYPAAHSVGINDSIEAVPRLVESHVIGRDDLDLYDRVVSVEYVQQVRGWVKFDSLEELITQIDLDVKQAAKILEAEQ